MVAQQKGCLSLRRGPASSLRGDAGRRSVSQSSCCASVVRPSPPPPSDRGSSRSSSALEKAEVVLSTANHRLRRASDRVPRPVARPLAGSEECGAPRGRQERAEEDEGEALLVTLNSPCAFSASPRTTTGTKTRSGLAGERVVFDIRTKCSSFSVAAPRR